MLYIQKGEKSRLPRKFRTVNNLCAHIYDQLTEIFTQEHYQKLTSTDIPIDREKQILVKEFESGKLHALDWLAENKLDKELTTVLTKHIVLSVVSDFVNFMYESMNCAKNGKFTVAYALLRKPLTDELLLLEQILYDKDDFIKRFYHQGEPIDYDPSSNKLDKKSIIKNALASLNPKGFFTEDLIYQLRYDKTCASGINGISNHALHIVTQDKNYRTCKRNLNFVFSVDEDHQEYLHHYYYFVPYLLMYSVAIVDEIIFSFLPEEDFQNLKAVKAFRRIVGFILWTEKTKTESRKKTTILMKNLEDVLNFDCHNCNHNNRLKRADYELFFESEILLCEKCFESILISKESLKPIHDFIQLLK
jgi:hypothetical protein